jgi:hypothetical protein
LAKPKADVIPEELDTGAHSPITHGLFHLLDAAEVGQCGPARLGRRHARGSPFIRDHVDVSADLIVKLALNLLLAQEIPNAVFDTRSKSHPAL